MSAFSYDKRRQVTLHIMLRSSFFPSRILSKLNRTMSFHMGGKFASWYVVSNGDSSIKQQVNSSLLGLICDILVFALFRT